MAANYTRKFAPDAATAGRNLRRLGLQIISWVSVVLMLIRLEQDALSAAPVNRRTVIRIASTKSALSLLPVFRLLSRLNDLVERELQRIARSRAEDVVRTKELATLVAQLAGRL